MVNFTHKFKVANQNHLIDSTVSDLMTRSFVHLKSDMFLEDVVDLFAKSDSFLGGPVVDGDMKIVGYMSEQACLKMLANNLVHNYEGQRVSDVMYKGETLSMSQDTSLFDALDMFLSSWHYVYPVTDTSGRVVGILKRKDLLRALKKHSPTTW